MVYRIYVEKKPHLAHEAKALLGELTGLLGIEGISRVRILNRYDAEGLEPGLFETCKKTVFAEPQLDLVSETPDLANASYFAVEFLPGQFDQRADSAAQCIQIISQGERPLIRTAKVYAFYGDVSETDLEKIKKYVINPVEAREASMTLPLTLKTDYEIPQTVETLSGFISLTDEALPDYAAAFGLAMDAADLAVCRDYFAKEGRDPTITELRMIDTYWSDHCRHTTFHTVIDEAILSDPLLEGAYRDYLALRIELGRTKPVCLMDLATIGARYLKAKGLLPDLDESEEINACTVKIQVTGAGGEKEDWLLLFKNETHNHPTEIEPFGGAATCIGGAIRDPLSGRAYVYAAMRLTGAADPTVPVSETLPGKLPQRKLVTTAAAGYSAYGNQIGIATGLVDELYHPGYAAKRMEIGAVIGAAPAENVRRLTPAPGDLILLLGGRTGRDGCGGATGSSKSHTAASIEVCGAEVQKGNAPEERKLQRLFRNAEAARLIKRCNDFGAGGVSVAIGELADGVEINLNAVPKKYEGLDGTELAISESQERMAVVVSPEDAERFMALADAENLEATVVARVTEEPRLVMYWNGESIVDIARSFLDENGADKHIRVAPAAPQPFEKQVNDEASFTQLYKTLAGDLNVCSKQGLSERFDATIGSGTVLMPFGGTRQKTPIQAMVHKISREFGDTDTASFMSWGFNPYISEKSPFHGAYLAVAESLSKLAATGADASKAYLSFQEYFEKPGTDETRWGKPFAALLGALKAQLGLGVAAIGGKDSMSGSFEDLHVPPTLVSFAVAAGSADSVCSPEFKRAGSRVLWLKPQTDENGLPRASSLKALFKQVHEGIAKGEILSAYTPGFGGAAEAILKMCLGNGLGFSFAPGLSKKELFSYAYGSFILELSENADWAGTLLGVTAIEEHLSLDGEILPLHTLFKIYEDKLEEVFTTRAAPAGVTPVPVSYAAGKRPTPASHPAITHQVTPMKVSAPRVLIPVFPGTNCEYDSAKAFARAGAVPEILVIRNLTAGHIAQSAEEFARRLREAQMIFIPGGFSGGDEPDGSGKFITAFFRNPRVREQTEALLQTRDGLICGICNGFQALVKLGLVPYGRILEPDEKSPTLTYNTIGRHQSRLVRVRVASNLSPWLSNNRVGDIHTVAISHGEGRFLADPAVIETLVKNGQIATQYVDEKGEAAAALPDNPAGSDFAVEGITSPDGRVFGRMGHTERAGAGLYQNVPGTFDLEMFTSAVRYFR